MTWRFDEPAWWWALLLLGPIVASWWAMDRIAPVRRSLAVLLRCLAIACVVAALARPWLLTTQSSIVVIGVIDASGSVDRFSPRSPAEIAATFLQAATQRPRDDRVGLVAFDGQARAMLVPTSAAAETDPVRLLDDTGSALADAVTLARALVPAGEAGRVIVFSDGLETVDRAADIAAVDAGRVAIDTVLLPLERFDDVAIESFDLPASAPPGARVSAIVTIRSDGATSGTLRILMDGRALPLRDGDAESSGISIDVERGTTRVRISIPIGDGPVHELEAIFEPHDPSLDGIAENDRARRVIAVPAGRSVLILDRSGTADALDSTLRSEGFEVRRRPADAVPDDPLWLAGFDLVVLDDVPAAMMPMSSQRMLADQVQHLGAGLLALGGPGTFGAGGWRGSTLAELLPVEVEPPTEDRRPRAALVFVIDRSGSMRQSVAGTRSTQQEIANEAAALAVESIASRAIVGVVAFDNSPSVIVPPAPMDDPAQVAERIRGIRSDGGTAIGAALEVALDGIEPIRGVDRKLVIVLTDGRGRDDELLLEQSERAARLGAVVTTISIGDSADDALLSQVAERTGGVFHPVRNPRVLPRVLVESVQSINRPLVREGAIGVVPQGDSETAMSLRGAPALGGLCLMGRPRSSETVIDAVTDQGEPLLSRWLAGIGRVAAFASSAGDPWAGDWSGWPGRDEFWIRLARWAARPPGSSPVAAEARIEDGRFIVTIDAGAADAVTGATVEGLVRAPDGTRRPFELRRSAPRRFTGAVDAAAQGPWLAVLSPRGASGPLPPLLAVAIAPEGAEYARQDPDAAPLDALRAATGGRDLPLESLGGADLFSRDGLALGVRERSIAPWLLAGAALLFVADATVRRLAVRRSQVAEALRVTSASAEAAGSLATRRRTVGGGSAMSTEHAAHRAGAAATGADPRADADRPRRESVPPPSDPSRRAPSAAPPAAPGPTAEEVDAALEILRRAPPPPAAAPGDDREPARTDADADAGASSAAVEALRRAKDRSRIFPP